MVTPRSWRGRSSSVPWPDTYTTPSSSIARPSSVAISPASEGLGASAVTSHCSSSVVPAGTARTKRNVKPSPSGWQRCEKWVAVSAISRAVTCGPLAISVPNGLRAA